MQGDNMHQFIRALLQFSLVCSAILAPVLILLAAVLIWKPELLVSFLRYGIAGICLLGAGWVIITLIRMAFVGKKGWKN